MKGFFATRCPSSSGMHDNWSITSRLVIYIMPINSVSSKG